MTSPFPSPPPPTPSVTASISLPSAHTHRSKPRPLTGQLLSSSRHSACDYYSNHCNLPPPPPPHPHPPTPHPGSQRLPALAPLLRWQPGFGNCRSWTAAGPLPAPLLIRQPRHEPQLDRVNKQGTELVSPRQSRCHFHQGLAASGSWVR